MANPLVLYFEQANFPTVLPLFRHLPDAVFVKGFDYKEHTGVIPPWSPPKDVPTLSPPEPSPDCLEKWLRASEAPLPPAAARYAHLRPIWARWGAVTETLFDTLAPPAVIVPEDTDYIRGRLAARLARERGIPVIVLLAHYYDRFVDYPLVGPRYGDVYLVLNMLSAARLVGAGVPPQAIHVVGNQALEFAAVRAPNRSRFLLCEQGTHSEAEWIEDLFEWAAAHPEVELWVRPHPLTRHSYFRNVAPNVRAAPALALEETFAEVGCVIAESSATLWQATAAGLPILIPHYRFGPLPIALPGAAHARVTKTRAAFHAELARLAAGEVAPIDRRTLLGSAALDGSLEQLLAVLREHLFVPLERRVAVAQ